MPYIIQFSTVAITLTYINISYIILKSMQSLYISLYTYHIYLSEINLDKAKLLSRMEEEYQLDLWGLVEGGQDMDRLNNCVNLASTG